MDNDPRGLPRLVQEMSAQFAVASELPRLVQEMSAQFAAASELPRLVQEMSAQFSAGSKTHPSDYFGSADLCRGVRGGVALAAFYLLVFLASTDVGREWLRDYGYLLPVLVPLLFYVRKQL